jgi:hypothetical protein
MVNRTKYVVMIGFGFGISVLVGLWVAIQVSVGQSLSGLLGIALLGFIPSALLSGYGAYQVIQIGEEPDVIPDVDIRQQRELVDLIHERGKISIADASQELAISEHHVRDAIRQLLELGIFTGDVDWNEDVLDSQKMQKLN